MSGITSHVLDTSRGVPGEGIPVILQINRGSSDDTRWKVVGQGKTDADGRVPDLVAGKFETGHYRISFHVAEYFEGLGQETPMSITMFRFCSMLSDIRLIVVVS